VLEDKTYVGDCSITSQESEVLSIIRYRGTSKIAGQLCFFIVAQRSSRCPYTLLLIELPTPVITLKTNFFKYIVVVSVSDKIPEAVTVNTFEPDLYETINVIHMSLIKL
jgi:hypothetical protein